MREVDMPKLFQVDSFTSEIFKGNPAGVCILSGPANEGWMQGIAREMNVSETAFIYPQRNGYNLRWFTPQVEVDLCGHATLATAHILWEQGIFPKEKKLDFYTKSGRLQAFKKHDWIVLDFPAEPATRYSVSDELIQALGVKVQFSGKNRFDYLILIESEEKLLKLKPDMDRLARCTERGVIVTSLPSRPGYDFVSRFFAPAIGINEDPVTGSAHCCLGPFWRERLYKYDLLAYQASSRGGVVKVNVDLSHERVELGGQAVTVFRAEVDQPTAVDLV
ncbi:PhzF family phenazine biosynthesis protein [candidate division KSB1 bacterium]|nr:PhzF family phenazine biosynthesis protein [candidate division KSB1 bacterium]